ncbi:hypothetical protein [Streptomyces noursei]|uniref:Uncharacterized protein n=1 Tax=Streptomyces noursei TaxID=1971 RepID=A0A2N8PKV5_STRNR|nr:hypothetical protein [Streptomyces noursei]PNE41611.1 hypothetical protein AOB60_13365 [Streptomyces noursei]
MSTSTQTTWPEGVIARYLTVVGSTVDLSGKKYNTAGTCGGCQEEFSESNYIARDLSAARHWAQAHAEMCRALPRRGRP